MTHSEPVGDADGGPHEVPPRASAVLDIDLAALRANYRDLKNLCAPAECAAVVKADGYGLGAEPVAAALVKEGCTNLFVANLDEAIALRRVLGSARIFVLDGLFKKTEPEFEAHRLIPVLGSLPEIEDWSNFCIRRGMRLRAAVHIDTGMNRLGLKPGEAAVLMEDPGLFASFDLALVMSHLACADTPEHPKNAEQADAFDVLRADLPRAPASLASSAGVLAHNRYHYDLTRPGIALYGGRALAAPPNPMRPVVRLRARIAQLRRADPGETVGYGAEHRLTRPTLIATLSLGYADGYHRVLGASNAAPGGAVYFGDQRAPVLGRVSMDLLTVDVTDVDERSVQRDAFADVLGPHCTIDDVADQAGTIGYEILTSLGHRFPRLYRGA